MAALCSSTKLASYHWSCNRCFCGYCRRKIYRVGDIKPIPVDFRLIAATNRDLKGAVNEGLFRKDLYFRLSTVTISLDPLSGRKEDIEGIAQLVMARIRKTDDIAAKRFSPGLMTALKSREWPGNIRELANVVECMCFMSTNETLTIDDLPEGYRPGKAIWSRSTSTPSSPRPRATWTGLKSPPSRPPSNRRKAT